MIPKTTLPALAAGLGLLAAASGASAATAHFKGATLAHAASVSLTQARSIALRARPGKVTDQELEKEAGGSGLRYSFDIASRGRTFEVGVDAKSGDVLENAAEGAHPD